jgi:hypothetical protein
MFSPPSEPSATTTPMTNSPSSPLLCSPLQLEMAPAVFPPRAQPFLVPHCPRPLSRLGICGTTRAQTSTSLNPSRLSAPACRHTRRTVLLGGRMSDCASLALRVLCAPTEAGFGGKLKRLYCTALYGGDGHGHGGAVASPPSLRVTVTVASVVKRLA